MPIIEITKDNFVEEVINSDKPVMLDFYSTTCSLCYMLDSVLKEVADEYGDVVKVGKINVNMENGLADRFNIAALPTVVIMIGGHVRNKVAGYRNKEYLINMFDWWNYRIKPERLKKTGR